MELLPRLTTFLRCLSTDPVDVEKEYVARRLSGRGASSPATSFSSFSDSVIGPRASATKGQRDAFDAFIAACKKLTGGAFACFDAGSSSVSPAKFCGFHCRLAIHSLRRRVNGR